MLKNTNLNESEKVKEQTKKLDPKELEKINGAGDPFANIKRNPEKEYDEKLRKNG